MSILETAKAKAAKGNLKGAFTNESGAIDLASIMVGIIVIGLIGGVIAATVFAVIPWAQDNAARQQLESVVQAQNAYTGLSEGNTYGEAADLAGEGLLTLPADTTVDIVANDSAAGNGGAYAATVQSDSGTWFTVTSADAQPEGAGTTKPTTVTVGSGAGAPTLTFGA